MIGPVQRHILISLEDYGAMTERQLFAACAERFPATTCSSVSSSVAGLFAAGAIVSAGAGLFAVADGVEARRYGLGVRQAWILRTLEALESVTWDRLRVIAADAGIQRRCAWSSLSSLVAGGLVRDVGGAFGLAVDP